MYFITKPQTIKIPEKFVERDYVLPRIASVQNPLRVAVFISGSGSGLNAMLEYQKTPRAYLISLILSDNEDALGLNYGSKYGVKATAIPLPHTQDKIHQRLSHEAMIDEELVNSNKERIQNINDGEQIVVGVNKFIETAELLIFTLPYFQNFQDSTHTKELLTLLRKLMV